MSAFQTSRPTRRGFTYIELLLAGMVTTIGLVGYAASLVSTLDLRTATAESVRGMNVARFAAEEIESIGNLDYVINNLNGYSFSVPTLEGPKAGLAFPDGTYPTFYPSGALPPVPGAYLPQQGAGPEDPALGIAYERQPIALQPASDSKRGFGSIRIDASNPDLVRISVSIQFHTTRGNRKITVHSHLLRPVNPETFRF